MTQYAYMWLMVVLVCAMIQVSVSAVDTPSKPSGVPANKASTVVAKESKKQEAKDTDEDEDDWEEEDDDDDDDDEDVWDTASEELDEDEDDEDDTEGKTKKHSHAREKQGTNPTNASSTSQPTARPIPAPRKSRDTKDTQSTVEETNDEDAMQWSGKSSQGPNRLVPVRTNWKETAQQRHQRKKRERQEKKTLAALKRRNARLATEARRLEREKRTGIKQPPSARDILKESMDTVRTAAALQTQRDLYETFGLEVPPPAPSNVATTSSKTTASASATTEKATSAKATKAKKQAEDDESDADADADKKKGLSSGVIIAIVAGAVAVFLLLCVGLIFVLRQSPSEPAMPPPEFSHVPQQSSLDVQIPGGFTPSANVNVIELPPVVTVRRAPSMRPPTDIIL